jgi:hypothetical protein
MQVTLFDIDELQVEAKRKESDFEYILTKIEEMFKNRPDIAKKADNDLILAAKAAKDKRVKKAIKANKIYQLIDEIPGFEYPQKTTFEEFDLHIGRPRIPTIVVVAIAIVGEMVGGYNKRHFSLILENKFFNEFLKKYNNGKDICNESCRVLVNSLSKETLELILAYTCKVAQAEKLDPIEHVIGDSTHVKANSRTPSDGELLFFTTRCIINIINQCQKVYPSLVSKNEAKKLVMFLEKICKWRHNYNLTKRTPEKKEEELALGVKLYMDVFHLTDMIYERIEELSCEQIILADKAKFLGDQLMDLYNLIECIRDFEKVDSAGQPKVKSRSDKDASWIVKGNLRGPHFGFRTQILTSEKGMITAIITPKGNIQDVNMLDKLINKHLSHIQTTKYFSFDDGYTSKENWEFGNKKQIVISFKGSKAKKLMKEKYNDAELEEIRRKRSIVEGAISRLKQITTLGQVYSRGLKKVEKELLRKAILANFLTLKRLEKNSKNSQIAA